MDILIIALYFIFGLSIFLLGVTSILSLLKLLNIWELNGTNAYKLLLANIVVFVVSILGLALLYNIS